MSLPCSKRNVSPDMILPCSRAKDSPTSGDQPALGEDTRRGRLPMEVLNVCVSRIPLGIRPFRTLARPVKGAGAYVHMYQGHGLFRLGASTGPPKYKIFGRFSRAKNWSSTRYSPRWGTRCSLQGALKCILVCFPSYLDKYVFWRLVQWYGAS